MSEETASLKKTFTAQKPLYTQLATANLRDQGHGPDGSHGSYEVTIVFRHPVDRAGVDEQLDDAVKTPGDSGMGIPAGVGFVINTGDTPARQVRVELRTNDAGRLAWANAVIDAKSFGDARSTVVSHLGPLLSRLAFDADAPVDIFQVDVTEVATGDKDLAVVMRGRTRRWERFPEIRVAPPFFRAAFGIYREALNSTNPFYSLLCFFRVAEGARAYGAKQARYAVSQGVDPQKPVPLVEDLDDIGKDFPQLVGQRCTRAAAWIEKEYRLAVAHGLDKVLHAPDELVERDRYWRAVPLARQVARKLVDLEWQFRHKLGLTTIPDLDQ